MKVFAKISAVVGLSVLAGCDGVAVANAPADEMVMTAPADAPPAAIPGTPFELLPQVVVTGPALDLNWTQRYQANVAYVNTSGRPITVYSGPDGQDAIARLSPGNGGAIDACAVEVDMCSISFGANRARGWVFMSNMGPAPSA